MPRGSNAHRLTDEHRALGGQARSAAYRARLEGLSPSQLVREGYRIGYRTGRRTGFLEGVLAERFRVRAAHQQKGVTR